MLPVTARSKYLLVLAAVAIAVLVVGWRLRPLKTADHPSSQAEVSRLQRLTHRTSLDNMANYFAEVADRVKGSLVWVERLETSGIVWDASGAVLAASPPMMASVQGQIRGATETEHHLLTDLYSETPEFRLMKAPAELALVPVQINPVGALRAGSWLAVVRRGSRDTHEMEATLFSGSRVVRCGEVELREMLVGLAASNRPLGAGVFDLEGRLYGVVLHCDGVRRAITAESLGRAIDRARAIDSQIQFRYGFRPAEMSEIQRSYFGTETGLLVQEVWRDTLAWNLGIRPGDICVSLDNDPIARLDDLAVMTVPMYRPQYTLTVRRGRAERQIVFPPGTGLQADTELAKTDSVLFSSSAPSVVIRAVQTDSPAGRAGLQVGDLLVSTGPQFGSGRPNPDLLNSERRTPLFLVVERDHALHGLFLP